MAKFLFLLVGSFVHRRLRLYKLPQYSHLALDGLVFRKNALQGPDLVDMTRQRTLSVV
jgi:hypothetical protein